jgi:pilus assembly protein Flp/PilA
MSTLLTRLFLAFQARLRDDERGATAVEYALIVGLIAIAIITAVTALGTGLSSKFNAITDALS